MSTDRAISTAGSDYVGESHSSADDRKMALLAIEAASRNVEMGGRPFACVIARGGQVIAQSANLVAQTNDPTAHAEIVAIGAACRSLKTEHLEGCDIYVLAHPCPMCLGALYYCSPDRVVFLTTRDEYSPYYVDDRKYFELATLYEEFSKPWRNRRLPLEFRPDPEALAVYERWADIQR